MKIIVKEPNGPYSASLDTEVMQVVIKEAFLGVIFESPDGERLLVIMRDGGFEVEYLGGDDVKGFSSGTYEFKGGMVRDPNTNQKGLMIDDVG